LDEDETLHEETLRERILAELERVYTSKEALVGATWMRHFEKSILLQVLDSQWKEHLASMDYLRQGIHLRGYAQKNPKQEYKREAFEMFSAMLERIQQETISFLSRVQFQQERAPEPVPVRKQAEAEQLHFEHAEASALATEEAAAPGHTPYVRQGRKVGRNEPCPCGSGKKYKHCHGRLN
jgi:preprotein translocase subunit SecA